MNECKLESDVLLFGFGFGLGICVGIGIDFGIDFGIEISSMCIGD